MTTQNHVRSFCMFLHACSHALISHARALFLTRHKYLRMLESKVLMVGMSGIAVEICKNVALAGINLCIADDGEMVTADLSSNFLVDASALGKKVRAGPARWTTHASSTCMPSARPSVAPPLLVHKSCCPAC